MTFDELVAPGKIHEPLSREEEEFLRTNMKNSVKELEEMDEGQMKQVGMLGITLYLRLLRTIELARGEPVH